MDELYNHAIEVSEKSKIKDNIETLREDFKNQKYTIAYDLAFSSIVQGAEDKICESAKLGYTRTDIFSYRRSDNLKFNGVYLIDILRKGKDNQGDIMMRLSKHFSPFQVYIRCFPSKNNDSRYVIYVSWFKNEEEISL